jgi:DNA repair photolyase
MTRKLPDTIPIQPIRGRGTLTNRPSRFDQRQREADGDFIDQSRLYDEPVVPIKTQVTLQPARGMITRNQSPDIPFDRSINPYFGCEHGCVYCFARPTHAYLGLSPGLDFETRLFAKQNAAAVLRSELSARSYRPALIALGTSTDPYQPIERTLYITRSIIEVLGAFNHPFGITTKSALVVRDIDLLAPIARRGLARVYISITTLDHEVARKLEPRASSPLRRLAALRALADAGIPVGVMVAPIIPAITDCDIEAVLAAAFDAGARYAGFTVLRLPLEVRDLFLEWLREHYPMRLEHVMSLINQMRGGRDYDATFGKRMRGEGIHAELIGKRFDLACKKLGMNREREALDLTQFAVPETAQMRLF